jgi:hypothetical protein
MQGGDWDYEDPQETLLYSCTRDPREEVLDELYDRLAAAFAGLAREDPPTVTETLEALDAADPLRAMLPEVVEALEVAGRAVTGAWRELLDVLDSIEDGRAHLDGDEFHSRLGLIQDAHDKIDATLAKLRETHPTTGGTDDGE